MNRRMRRRRVLSGLTFTTALLGCGARSGLDVASGGATSVAMVSSVVSSGVSSATSSTSTGAGVPMCLADGATCTGVGQCCHACIAGACGVLTACHPGDAPTTLATDAFYDETSLLVDGESLYYHSAAGIVRMPKNGGATSLVGPALEQTGEIGSFTMSPSALFYADFTGGHGIQRVEKATGARTTLGVLGSALPDPPSADVLTYANGFIHYEESVSAGAKFGRIAENGTMKIDTVFVATPPGQGAVWPFLGADAEAIYHSDTTLALVRTNLDGSPPVTLFPAAGGALALAFENHRLYASVNSSIEWVTATGGSATVVSKHGATFLTADGDTIYFADGMGTYRDVPGSPPTLLAPAMVYAEQVVVDDSCVYWMDGGQGAPTGHILRAPK